MPVDRLTRSLMGCLLLGCGRPVDGPAAPPDEPSRGRSDCARSWYVDLDGDGYGADARWACVAPPHGTLNGGDCDDTRPEINPGADEVCDDADVDEDCNGAADDDDRDFAGQVRQYEDRDGDGYGSGYPLFYTCEPQPEYATQALDCDDDDPTFHPGAPEVCGDGIDHSCGGADCVEISLHDATAVFRKVDPDDIVHGAVRGGGDIDGDGRTDVLMSVSYAHYFGAPLGAVYLFTEPLEGELTEGDTQAIVRGVDYGHLFGSSATFIDDTNGDGASELVVASATSVMLFTSPFEGLRLADAPDAEFANPEPGYRVRLEAFGDLDGDGAGDFVTAHYGATTAEAYVHDGATRGAFTPADEALLSIEGIAWENPGSGGMSPLDFDGDGVEDIAVAGDLPSGTKAVLVFAGQQGIVHLENAIFTLTRSDCSTPGFAFSLAGVDHDGDGLDELAVASYVSSSAPDCERGIHLYDLLPVDGPGASSEVARIIGNTSENLPSSMANAGDVDGDGREDVLAGAPDTYWGGGYVWLGPLCGTLTSVDAAIYVGGEVYEDPPGVGVGSIGDPDGDGRSAIAVSGFSAHYLFDGISLGGEL